MYDGSKTSRGTASSNLASSTGESTANLSFRVGIASMTVGCEEIRRAWHRHVTVGAYYKRAVRRLEQEATMPAPRDRLADVALQYGKLAEGAESGLPRSRIEGPSARSPQHRVNREHPNQNADRLVLVSNSGEQALLDRYRHRPCVSVTSSLALSIWAALIPAACWRWQSCDDP